MYMDMNILKQQIGKKKKRFLINEIQDDLFFLLFAMLFFICLYLLGIGLGKRDVFMLAFWGIFVSAIFIVTTKTLFGTAFLISFFVFLCGRLLVNWVKGSVSLLKGAFIYTEPSDQKAIMIISLLVLSIIAFTFGCLLKQDNSIERRNSSPNKQDKDNSISHIIEIMAICLFYISAIFSIMVSFEKVVFVHEYGYLEYYLSFKRNLPSFLYEIAELNKIAFFSALAMRFNKKKTIPIIIVYLFNAALLMLAGQRNHIVRALLIVVVYLLVCRKLEGKKILTKLMALGLIIVGIGAVVGMQAWGSIRNNTTFKFTNIFDTIISFFSDQGSTLAVIYQGLELKDKFPDGVNYTFAPIVNFFTNNLFGKWIFDPVIYQGQTVDLALNGNNYGATLFYLFNPKSYLEGSAMGTCYIAECLHDFGWIAVALLNCLYGYLLCRLDREFEKNKSRIGSWKIMILFLFVDGILYAPRDSALGWVVNGLNFSVLIYILLVFIIPILYHKYKNRSKRDE